MALLLVNLPGPVDRSWRLRDGSRSRCRPRVKPAAPNSFTRSGPLPHSRSGLSPSPATPQKPLRADEPVKQNGELDPFRAGGVGRRLTAGIETRVWSGQPPSGRVGSVHPHSVVGPHRSGTWVSRVLTIRSPVRGPIQAIRGRACAAARRARSSLRSRSRQRGRRWCPSSACSSPGRAGGSRVGLRRRSCLLLRGGFGFCFLSE